MTSTLRVFRTLAVAAAVLLYATAAAPQSAAQLQGHDHEGRAAMVRSQDGGVVAPSVMEQIAALDKRITMLATDMQMFSGELKVDVMASLLSAMIERQSLVEREMKTMREGMMSRMEGGMGRMEGMMGRRTEHREPPVASLEQEPGGMCAPSH